MPTAAQHHPSYDSLRTLKKAPQAQDAASLLPLIRSHFLDLLEDKGDWNYSVYDLAWVLCCGFFEGDEQRKFLGRMLSQQNEDGSWGDASCVPHSALVDTLGAVMALVRLQQEPPKRKELIASVDALLIKCREYPHHDTVAFELLAPKLLKWLESNGFPFALSSLSREFITKLDAKGDMKLGILRKHACLFEASSTLSYTAELAALMPLSAEEQGQLTQMMLPNGAIGLSPAATAAIIVLLKEQGRDVPPGLKKYLRDTFEDYKREGFPNLHPIVTSRRLWNVRPWLVSGNISALIQDKVILNCLKRIYEETNVDELERVSWDTNNSALPDLDDTAVAFALYCVLVKAGVKDLRPMSNAGFKQFRRKDGSFFCYAHELHPSPSAILHSLMAMEVAADPKALGEKFSNDPENQEMRETMLKQLNPEGQGLAQLCHDKWHATWTYGVQKWLSLRSLHATYPEKVKELAREVEKRTREGGWGQQAPTLEETAYVASGLVSLRNSELLAPSEWAEFDKLLRGARNFLLEQLGNEDISVPALWISKNMYAPQYQVVSAVLDALYGLAARS
jgi:hypothetical protein